uniref:SEFIR domain-containing protein n=1 Tax=Esox lucius TaxID=8010 RepID=A0AAY5KQD3_ESOLU
MRIFILNMLFTFFTAQASPSISVTCDESYGIPHEWTEIPEVSPSPLHSLRVDVLNEEVEDLRILNISWAINIDMTDKKTDVDASPALLIVRLGCLVGLVALVICALTLYKVYGIHTNHPFTDLTKEPMSVLIVYPAENLVFQRAVLAFAEFLQCHGGCKVTIDLWQLSRLAEQGLMRWLSEQVQFADRVIIISPQPKHYHIDPWEHAMPAASHDLFPLVLHMVASHARSPSELAKFWVVHLGKAPKKNGLPVELRSCRDFKLMQDLEKIVRHLHPVQDSKKLLLNLRSRLAYGERVTEKLRNAVQQLEAWRSSQVVESREPAPLVTILKT